VPGYPQGFVRNTYARLSAGTVTIQSWALLRVVKVPLARDFRMMSSTMGKGTSQEDATLLDVLVDGFEKNETWGGYHWRDLPMPDTLMNVRRC